MTQRVVLRCPADPADVPSWLVSVAARNHGRAVALDLSAAAHWLRSAPDVVDLCNRLGMDVRGVFGARDALGADVRILVQAQILRPWCVIPEVDPVVVNHRVRAGQTLSHESGDVDVRESIASGGRVIAGGSVRVGGRFGGWIMAGLVSAEAVVLCGSLNAEMVSIGGHFVVGDRIDPSVIDRPCRISLVAGRVVFAPVDAAEVLGAA